MMACHTAAQTALYQRGYPYLVELTDGHKDDKKPSSIVTRAYKSYWGPYHVAWPRLTAAAFVRASAVCVDGDWSAPEVAKAASATGAISTDEARAIVAGWFENADRPSWYQVHHPVLVLEALAGTDAVLDAISERLERRIDAPEDGEKEHGLFAFVTGFLLLRCTKANERRARLEAVYQAGVKKGLAVGEHSLRGALDLALHGNEGAARALANSHWQYWYYYLMVDDPAEHLARLARPYKSDWVPEPRILFLAGPELLPVYTSKKALRQGKRLPDILHDFGMFADERILELMIEMVGVKGAADAPARYFRDHADYARPRLERLAKGSSASAAKAGAALASLSSRR
jgi:hypothetical protein